MFSKTIKNNNTYKNKVELEKMSRVQVVQSKSSMFPTSRSKRNSILVVISLLLSLFPSALGEITANSNSSSNNSSKTTTTTTSTTAQPFITPTRGNNTVGRFLNSSPEVKERSERSSNKGWLWNSEDRNEKSNSENSAYSRVEVPGKKESSLSAEIVDSVGKQVHEEPASAFEIIEPRGYFTFLYGTTSPVPPATTPTAPSTTLSNVCICVPYYQCEESQIVADGTGIIDIRHGSGCHSVLEVCCRNPLPTTVGPPSTSPSSSPATAIPGFVSQCGTLNPNGINARILGFKDSETQFGEYPWMGAILESKYIGGKWVLQFLCGASLITPRVIVTAAHCVKGKRIGHLIIRLGEWDTQTTNEFYPYQDIKVSEVVIHPQFYSGGLYNDIALVFLTNSAILAPHVDTICLPEITPQYDSTACWATGWGKSAFGAAGQYQAILREVELGTSSKDVCQTALRRTNLGSKFNLHDSFICAGGLKNLDTCVGDGGGPLVCPSLIDPWRYVLVGIVSWGVQCGTYGVPGVYTNVPRFRNWIDNEIVKRIPTYNPSRWTISGSATQGTGPQPSG